MVDDTPINTIVDRVLEESEFTETRASKMDVDDLLKYVMLNSSGLRSFFLLSIQATSRIPRGWNPFFITARIIIFLIGCTPPQILLLQLIFVSLLAQRHDSIFFTFLLI